MCRSVAGFLALLLLNTTGVAYSADDTAALRWLERFRFHPPEVESQGVCAGTIGALPTFEINVAEPGTRLVRVSVPFAPGAFPAELGIRLTCGGNDGVVPDVRILTLHPGSPKSVRRAMLTFPFSFVNAGTYRFALELADPLPAKEPPRENKAPDQWAFVLGEMGVALTPDSVSVVTAPDVKWEAKLIAPARARLEQPVVEVVESGAYFWWIRLLVPDREWPRIIEVRADSLGTIAVQAHVQRLGKGDATAPDLGWDIKGPPVNPADRHAFGDGQPFGLETAQGEFRVDFPVAGFDRRGSVETVADQGQSTVRFLRCTAKEKVPFQESAWRRAAFVIGKKGYMPRNALLDPAVDVRISPANCSAAYGFGMTPDLAVWPVLQELLDYTHAAITKSVVVGDDFGNVTAFNDGQPAPAFGMNRLNHGPAILEESWRTGNAALRDVAVQWCGNMYDVSLWWADQDEFGGTRYNNANAAGSKDHLDDTNYMWRGNNAVHFCTKGIDTFLYAYEETGDPRMVAALNAQVAYSRKYVHTDQGECRNIGDVADLMRLYKYTGVTSHRDEALRLFRELRTKLSPGDLFSQGGQPIVEDPPFIDDDERGYRAPFAKPYIIGYALAGLPDLLRACPDEPKLRDVVRAVADFLASSQDPAGGWRYPHPASTRMILDQAMEHAAHLARAAGVLEERGEPIGRLLDAIERTLQARVTAFARSGKILSALQGWESNPGNLKEGQTVYDLYKKPTDRNPARDYTEGQVGTGGSCPEGLVYFPEVLAFYLAHRPAERLFHANETLNAVLARIESKPTSPVTTAVRAEPLRCGLRAELPTFRDAQVGRMTFPLAWTHAGLPFAEWRVKARRAYLDALLPAPPKTSFDPEVIAVEDRGSYEARKLALNLSADSRVIAYLLIPKGKGPFPAMLALHDHGAHFSIGKEKVIRPFGESEDRIKDAETWVKACYGGKYIGDELAQRGYVVFATDALFWGDRGRAEGVRYEAQQALAANMYQLGLSWAGTIVWDDLRSAEFVQGLPEVDPDRIGCAGLSMGAHRTWSLAAATDIIKIGLAICWMGDTPTLTSEGNNQTKGQSAFSMLHPNLRNLLDYPDVASIACPKPMLFYNGEQDGLFPVPGVQACYAKMQAVWHDRNKDASLVTKLWPVPHEFNTGMQAEAFAWLDQQMAALRP